MDAFLQNISSFPTAIYSTGLVVVVGYWLIVVLGLFDFDVFDADVDLEIESDVGEIGGIAGLLTTLGLTGVPITVVISLLILNGWFISYFSSMYTPNFFEYVGLVLFLINTGIVIISLMISIPVTATMIKPLKGLFKKIHQQPIHLSLLGRPCQVRSSRVDHNFGEAECQHRGASLTLKVRSGGDAIFSTGETVFIIEHDKHDNTYLVVSEKEFNRQMK